MKSILKQVDNYLFDLNAYSHGDHSQLLLGKNGKNSPFEYITKCISVYQANEIIQLIKNEINLAQNYKSTNCIVIYKEAKRTTSNLYLIYKFFDSYSLRELISHPPPDFKSNDWINLALNIAKLLNQLHMFKLIHRNLNPSHILVSKDFKKILLCGVKSIYDFNQGYTSEMIGAYPYMAPEIVHAAVLEQKYDEKVDIYSFGVILSQLFTGNPNLTEAPGDIAKIKGISKRMKDLISNCLNVDPSKRISSSEIINSEYYKSDEEMQIPILPPNQEFDLEKVIRKKDNLYPYKKSKVPVEKQEGSEEKK